MDDKFKEKLDEYKSKSKDLLKRMGFSRTPATFKGQGYTLGGSSQSRSVPEPCATSSSSSPSCILGKVASCGSRPGSGVSNQQGDWRKLQQERWERERGIPPSTQNLNRAGQPVHNTSHMQRVTGGHVVENVNTLASASASVKSPIDNTIKVDDRESTGTVKVLNNEVLARNTNSRAQGAAFDPYSAILSSTGNLPLRGFSENREVQATGKVKCPVCSKMYDSEAEVDACIDECTKASEVSHETSDMKLGILEREQEGNMELDLDEAVATFLSGNPTSSSLDVILRLLQNVLSHPSDEKYRKIRLENPRIKEAILSSPQGLKLFLAIGFLLVGDGSEKVLVMGVPSSEQILRLEATISYVTSHKSANASVSGTTQPSRARIDRQLKIFYAPKDRREEKFDLPPSFYELSASEVRLEAEARRKKLEESKLLIPKSLRDKQTATAKRTFKATAIRVHLPDGLILQGFFDVQEPTTAVYEFVASVLNDAHESFELVLPAATKHRIIPRSLKAAGQSLTLEEADLVPKALLKYKAINGKIFTGLKSEYYGLCEQLSLTSLLDPTDLTQK